MRINKFVALSTGLSRRAADKAVEEGRVIINGQLAVSPAQVSDNDSVSLDGEPLKLPAQLQTVLINKPVGYVVSRDGQGSKTIYDLLPQELGHLKPIGRLDKDSSGLLLLTNDGELANQLTHPSFQKIKVYQIELDKPLQPLHQQMIADIGLQLPDGPSRLGLQRLRDADNQGWQVTMHQGRNRQIRRTFAALGYDVTKLHRTAFGSYKLDGLKPGKFKTL